MVLGGVGAGDQEALGLLEIRDGVRHCAGTECCGQTGHGGAVSESGAVIDVVGADHRAHKFLEEIVLFVRTSRRGKPCNGVGAGLFLYGLELFSHIADCLFPGRFLELAVYPDQGLGEPVRVVYEIVAEAALDAQAAVVRLRGVLPGVVTLTTCRL